MLIDENDEIKYFRRSTSSSDSDDDVERRKYLISSFSSINIVILFEFAKEDIQI